MRQAGGAKVDAPPTGGFAADLAFVGKWVYISRKFLIVR